MAHVKLPLLGFHPPRMLSRMCQTLISQCSIANWVTKHIPNSELVLSLLSPLLKRSPGQLCMKTFSHHILISPCQLACSSWRYDAVLWLSQGDYLTPRRLNNRCRWRCGGGRLGWPPRAPPPSTNSLLPQEQCTVRATKAQKLFLFESLILLMPWIHPTHTISYSLLPQQNFSSSRSVFQNVGKLCAPIKRWIYVNELPEFYNSFQLSSSGRWRRRRGE